MRRVHDILEGTRHLGSDNESDLGGEYSALVVDTCAKFGSFPDCLNNAGCTPAIDLDEPTPAGIRQRSDSSDILRSLLEAEGAGQQRIVRATVRQLPAERLADLVHGLLGKVAVGRQLAADDREETPNVTPVRLDDVLACYGRLGALGPSRQRPDTRIGIMNVVNREIGGGKHAVGFLDQVINLCRAGPDLVQFPVIANIGRSYQVQIVPGKDEERPPVRLRFDIEGVSRRTLERTDNDVAAFRATDKLRKLVACGCKDIIDPRPCRIDDRLRSDALLLTGQGVYESQTLYRPVMGLDRRYPSMGPYVGTGSTRSEQVLQHEALGKIHLPVVVTGRSDEVFTVQPALAAHDLAAIQHLVPWQALVPRQNVVGDHAEPNQPASALGARVDGYADAQRLHEVSCNLSQIATLVQGLVD